MYSTVIKATFIITDIFHKTTHIVYKWVLLTFSINFQQKKIIFGTSYIIGP